MKKLWMLSLCITLVYCGQNQEGEKSMSSFKSDVDFLQKYTDVIVLHGENNPQAQVAVVPAYQGRVMTSTAEGPDEASYGWINREFIASGENNPHINVFGGEDRFWLGPEGGQFSIFFKKGDPFDLEHWYTPAPVNEEPFLIRNQTASNISFEKNMILENYSGFKFHLEVLRDVNLLNSEQIQKTLGTQIDPSIKIVGFESVNTIKNAGTEPWTKESGLLSIWILGMFIPSPQTTVVIPFIAGSEEELGPVVNDRYFGKVPPDRLVINDDVLFFSGDGEYRSKIGIPPRRAKSVAGSYDARNHVLTIVQLPLPEGATDYVNSMWEIQDEPFAGDVINSYNDGPPAPGAKPMGPFYELETSSPAASLDPGEQLIHTHRTFHMRGDEAALDEIAQDVLGVGLEQIKKVF